MATKNFAKMATKKLMALMETASEEDKKAIQKVLDAREQVAAKAAEETQAEESTLTAEEEAAIAAAEANGGLNIMYNGSKATAEKKPKLTNEELHALAEELKANIGRKCQVVPFNTIEWVDGYIAGVVEEKRSNKVLYAIKTEDGRRIVKVHDSNLLRLMEETVTIERKKRTPKAAEQKEEWTAEQMEIEIAEIIENVGKIISFEKAVGAETKVIRGRIMAIVPDKRVQRLLYRIAVPEPTEEKPDNVVTMYKVSSAEGLTFEELDTEGMELNAKYIERRERALTRMPATPQDRVLKCEENLKKVEEKLAKLQAEVEEKKKQLTEAKAELDKYLASQVQAPAENEDLA